MATQRMLRHACILLCFAVAAATVGVDVSSAVSESEWKCLQTPGGQGPIEYAIVRVWRSTGSADPAAAATIKAARAAGIKYVDGYIFPCVPCGDPAGQVRKTKEMLDSAGAAVGMLWYDIERYNWPADKAANRAFVSAMIAEGQKLGVKAGVYAGWNSWTAIVGKEWANASAAGLPNWYAHYDNNPSFDDYEPFGGWTTPSIKQYKGDATSCGVGVDYNWYPSSQII
jgi:hypothetical protein